MRELRRRIEEKRHIARVKWYVLPVVHRFVGEEKPDRGCREAASNVIMQVPKFYRL